DLRYETHILHPPVDLRLALIVKLPVMNRDSVPMAEFRTHAAMGAVARSDLARERRLASRPRAGISVSEAPLAAVDATDLHRVADLAGTATHSTAAAAEAIGGLGGVRLVEAFETV